MHEHVGVDLKKLKDTQKFFNIFLKKPDTQIILSPYHTAWYKYPEFASIVFGIRKPHVHIYLPEGEVNFIPSHINIPIFPPGEKYIRAYTKCMEYYGGNLEMIVYNNEFVEDNYQTLSINDLYFFDTLYEVCKDGKTIDFKIKNCGSSACMQDAVRIVLYYSFLYNYIQRLSASSEIIDLQKNIQSHIFSPLDFKKDRVGIGGNLGKGRTRGYARVLDRENLGVRNEWYNKFDKGDIIIAHSTDVYYMSYIFDAGGIITENSNLLSHASLISRELGIPLVLGIENIFLKIFSGDLIEMNSDTGEVTIIKRFWEI